MKTILKLFVVAQFIGLICLNSQVTVLAKGAGSSAGITLLQPISAKASGMGEAYSSLSGELSCLHYNPAGLSSLEEQAVSFMYQRGLADDNFTTLLYGKKCPFAVLGASIVYYDTGKIEMYNTEGDLISKIGQKDVVLTIGGAKEIKGFPVGLNLKFISSEIFGESATAFAIDLGGQYKRDLADGQLQTGVSLQNLGTKLTYIDEGDSLPLTIRSGVSYMKEFSRNAVLVSCDTPYYVNEEEMLILLGVEYTYNKLFSLRGGYRLNMDDADKEDEPINIGMGITWKNYALDYAVGITEDLSIPHRVSVQLKF
ncbi:PorV/PorQ family protein [bacterium]|nr:PorV/PorQ family protein [bacterium]